MLSAPLTTLVATAESSPSLLPTPPHPCSAIAKLKANVEPNTLRIVIPPRQFAVGERALQAFDQASRPRDSRR
jgi:hypothetical protein